MQVYPCLTRLHCAGFQRLKLKRDNLFQFLLHHNLRHYSKVGAVSGLGFRQAVSKVSAFTIPSPKSAGAAAKPQSATLTIEAKGRTNVCAIAKTRKAASKRFKVTASGKVMHRRPGKQHLNGHMSTAHKKRLGQGLTLVHVRAQLQQLHDTFIS